MKNADMIRNMSDEELEEMANYGWIKVEDRLPNQLEIVVVLTRNYEVALSHLSENGNFTVHDTEDDLDYIMPVIAWHPIPEIHEDRFE